MLSFLSTLLSNTGEQRTQLIVDLIAARTVQSLLAIIRSPASPGALVLFRSYCKPYSELSSNVLVSLCRGEGGGGESPRPDGSVERNTRARLLSLG